MSFINAFLKYEFKLSWCNRREWLQPLFFFLIVMCLFPFAISSQPDMLMALFPGLFWIAVMLAHILSLPLIFQHDYDDGSIIYWRLQATPLFHLVSIKLICHGLLFWLMIMLLLPISMLLFHMPFYLLTAYILISIIVTPILTCLGALASSLTLSLKRGFLLLSLIVLPLYIPMLIFTTLALQNVAHHLPFNGELALLAAMSLTCIMGIPPAIVSALKVVA